MGKPTQGNQKGAQNHAEGQHGDATLERLREMNNEHTGDEDRASRRAANDPNRPGAEVDTAKLHERIHEGREDGGHRLMESRQQHDEAEKNSEKNRLEIDVERHKHDRDEFQIRGGGGTEHPNA